MDLREGISVLTSDDPKPQKVIEIKDGYTGDFKGVEMTWGSNEKCDSGGTNSFTAQILCQEE